MLEAFFPETNLFEENRPVKKHDLFTSESLETVRVRWEAAVGPATELFKQYREDRASELTISPCLRKWIAALEGGDLNAATDGDLWADLRKNGFVEILKGLPPKADNGVFRIRIISPKIFDGSRSAGEARSDYAFTTVKICMRIGIVSERVEIPEGLTDPRLVDLSVVELPFGVSEDNFDDREKIHLKYLVGLRQGDLVKIPIYIGVGTGEAYGRGPSQRDTQGRFRFYRYDVEENFHLEYIDFSESPEFRRSNVQELPEIPKISDATATLLLAKITASSSFMSISDPIVADVHREWLKENPRNEIVFKELTLKKKHYDLPHSSLGLPFAPDDIPAILKHAWQGQRYYYVAWQHPHRLSEIDGFLTYYDHLPRFLRQDI